MKEYNDTTENRMYKRKIVEQKKTIRALLGLSGLLAIIVVVFIILFLRAGNENSYDYYEEEGRFEGPPGYEEYTIQCEYKSKSSKHVCTYLMNVLKFKGRGYEKVAASVDKKFLPNNLFESIDGIYSAETNCLYESELECTRMDDEIVSIKSKVRFSTYGGFSTQEGTTFSVKSGEILEIDDLLKDKKGFHSVIDSLIVEQLPLTYPEISLECSNYVKIYKERYTDKKVLPQWHLENSGIAFSFEEMDFLSHSYGCLMVIVPYEKVAEYMKPEFVIW